MIERVIEFSVRNRYLVVLLTLAAAALGVLALQRLPIDAVPDITNRQVQINAVAPGLSPFEIEKQVTLPIENALAGIPGLQSSRSLSRNGFVQVTAVFEDRVDIYFARQQVGERLAEAREQLPAGIEPKLGPISTGLGEVYMWAVDFFPAETRRGRDGAAGLQSDGSYRTLEGARLATELERGAYLRTVQDWIVRPQLKTVPGVAGVDSIGGYIKQYHVQPDPTRMLARGVSFADLAAALDANNRSLGAGYLERNGEGYVVSVDGRLDSAAAIAAVVVATREAVPIRIGEIAEVAIGRELRTGSGSRNGHEAVIGTALMLVGGNSRDVAAAVDIRLREIARSLPPDVVVEPLLNRTQLVDATIATVQHNLAMGAALVIVVLFALLGNLRAALITALVIPVTMLLTASGMLAGRISANLMSLGALDFGLIVDGAVIIVENCMRRIAERQQALGRPLLPAERLTEVAAAARQMVRPSMYGQAIIMLVYVPLLTLSGIEGKMFEPMALTVIIALAAAFLLSMSFVPAMVAICMPRRVAEHENVAIRGLRRAFAPALQIALRRPALPIAIGLLTLALALAGVGYLRLGQEFIPTLDEKNIAMHAMRIPSAALTQSTSMQLGVERAIMRLPEVAYVFSKTGTAEVATDPMPPNVSDTFIMLKPGAADAGKDALVAKVATAVGQVPGHNYEYLQPIQMRFNELIAGVRGDIAVKIFGDDFPALLAAANTVAGVLRAVEGAVDIKVEQVAGLPRLDIRIDKAAIARRGLTIAQVQDVVAMAIGGRVSGAVYEGDRRHDIVLRLPDRLRDDIEALRELPVPVPTARDRTATVPLRELVRFEFGEGPNQVSRENGKRRIVVQANVRGRDIGSVVEEAQARIATAVTLPPGYWMAWGGQYENLLAARGRLAYVVPACFVLIFALLYGALGAARDALIVFSGVPLALCGGVFALLLAGMPFSISAAVGFIAVSGVAVLNGLVLASTIRELIGRGIPAETAIRDGTLVRLRPVVMTALVASLGFVPMALATGTGAEVQKPLATVVIGGLISSTLLTLVVLPALYRRFHGETPGEAATSVAVAAE
jgi:heavy metal efflux system protein